MIEEYARHNGHADLIGSRWTASSGTIRRGDSSPSMVSLSF